MAARHCWLCLPLSSGTCTACISNASIKAYGRVNSPRQRCFTSIRSNWPTSKPVSPSRALIRKRWQFMNKMKMTKQEVKEEAKMREGDPHVKGRIRSLQ
ncbi:MAG: EscU/YscU/HrcU family type III secretion system export apparatus switch protein, partial [Chloroflexi bacterium]|nr:EscU/YscU/HrcU family type III secretion system export apparatus switch protein [Chloroflexota bacterium]